MSALTFVACGSDDEYNADTAVSAYEALDADRYRMVKCVKMDTIDNEGREYEWCYNFVYDAKNRIERIEGEITRHVVNPNNKKIYRKYLSFTTNYRFKKSDVLDIVYIARVEYPEYTAWNTDVKYTFAGVFNADGTLLCFGPFDCEYMGGSLHKAYFDNRYNRYIIYEMFRDSDGNVTGYGCRDSEDKGADLRDLYKYSSYENNTNIDFSGLFGYWVVERVIAGNENHLEPLFQLAAFDMLGKRSKHLPDALWQFDSKGYPVSAKLSSGMNVTIEYLK